MKLSQPHLRTYFATGVIGCKCEKCGWSTKTSYVPGETAYETATRVFGNHVCATKPAGPVAASADPTIPLAKQPTAIPPSGEGL